MNQRKSISLSDVKDLKIDEFSTRTAGSGQPEAAIGLRDIRDAVVRLPVLRGTSADYIKVEGPQTKNIVLQSQGKAKQPARYTVAPSVKQEVMIN